MLYEHRVRDLAMNDGLKSVPHQGRVKCSQSSLGCSLVTAGGQSLAENEELESGAITSPATVRGEERHRAFQNGM